MKVTLFNSSFYKSRRKDYIEDIRPCLRNGIASLASFLRTNDVSVLIEDPQAENLPLSKIINKVLLTKPDVVGLPAYTEEVNFASKIATQIKNHNPTITTIIGGPHVSALPTETLRDFPSFDIGVVGEGELTLTEIAKDKELNKINGIVYRKNKKIILNPPRRLLEPLDILPFPAWDLYNLKRYHNNLPVEPLRGCPHSCLFCQRVLGRKVRYKTPKRIVDEIHHNIQNYGIHSFTLSAGTFPLNKRHATKFCDELINRKLNIKWVASTRVDTVDNDLLELMKNSGCKRLQFGVESGDPEILKSCGKGINPEDAYDVFKLCKKIGIGAGANFILGHPFETKETILKTHRLALKIRKYACDMNFAILVPFPGTEIYKMALNNQGGLKIKTQNWEDYGKQAGEALEHENFTSREIKRYQSKFYMSYYLRSPLKILKWFSWRRAFQLLRNFY